MKDRSDFRTVTTIVPSIVDVKEVHFKLVRPLRVLTFLRKEDDVRSKNDFSPGVSITESSKFGGV